MVRPSLSICGLGSVLASISEVEDEAERKHDDGSSSSDHGLSQLGKDVVATC